MQNDFLFGPACSYNTVASYSCLHVLMALPCDDMLASYRLTDY